jgi:linoleoyl-CoA desaturase
MYIPPAFENKKSPFYQALRERVDLYFESNGLHRHGGNALVWKAFMLFGLYGLLYAILVWGNLTPGVALLACVAMGLVHAGIGFGIMHDAAHGSFSDNRLLNHVLSFSANLLGGNSFLWKIKHNIIHHTYTNIEGADQDIAHQPVLSLNAHQPKQWWHRYQHFYGWLVYALSLILWVFALDLHKYLSRRVGSFPIRSITTADHLIFWISKLGFVAVYLVVPSFYWGWLYTLTGFFVVFGVSGFVLSTVFQLAHVVEETSFPFPEGSKNRIEEEWAIHQMRTTANFCTSNKLLTWYTGGLNFQVEHHLFAKISHIHYPALRPIVQQTALEYGVPYHEFRTLPQAVTSHYRHLRTVGVPLEAMVEMG